LNHLSVALPGTGQLSSFGGTFVSYYLL